MNNNRCMSASFMNRINSTLPACVSAINPQQPTRIDDLNSIIIEYATSNTVCSKCKLTIKEHGGFLWISKWITKVMQTEKYSNNRPKMTSAAVAIEAFFEEYSPKVEKCKRSVV